MKSILLLLIFTWMILPVGVHAQEPNEEQHQSMMAQRLFASPDDAVKALQGAVQDKDKGTLRAIFGPQVQDLLTGDHVQDEKNAQRFAAAMAQGFTLDREAEDKIIITIGPDNWPMPIPLVKINGYWLFDTAAGKEEIINRHIGKDELSAIGVCRAYVSAHGQYDFKKKGYGPFLFHGYLFRILHRGHSPDTFALVAYPVKWDHSGVMTFIVNQEGKIYQRNLGEDTFHIARQMQEYNPDQDWTLVADEGVL